MERMVSTSRFRFCSVTVVFLVRTLYRYLRERKEKITHWNESQAQGPLVTLGGRGRAISDPVSTIPIQMRQNSPLKENGRQCFEALNNQGHTNPNRGKRTAKPLKTAILKLECTRESAGELDEVGVWEATWRWDSGGWGNTRHRPFHTLPMILMLVEQVETRGSSWIPKRSQ